MHVFSRRRFSQDIFFLYYKKYENLEGPCAMENYLVITRKLPGCNGLLSLYYKITVNDKIYGTSGNTQSPYQWIGGHNFPFKISKIIVYFVVIRTPTFIFWQCIHICILLQMLAQQCWGEGVTPHDSWGCCIQRKTSRSVSWCS